MTLNSRVIAALNAGVDADKFEQCAVALMMKTFENVVPVEGGSDGGRDADIYGPIAGDPDSRGRILVTTGDSLDNLKSSHKTWQGFWKSGEPFRVDQIVMVTSNSLSDTKRRNILTYCRKEKLPTPTFYARDWLVEKLRKDSGLRTELTGVRGRLEAVGPRRDEAKHDHRLIGRDADLDRLRTAISGGQDVVLVGVPGVGKSRLLAELPEAMYYVEPLAREYLTDDLVEIDPEIVVLDDAHLHVALLEELVQVRSREQLPFRILAVSWPGGEGKLEALLIDANQVILDRLARPDLDGLIQELGVHSVRARTYVLDHSDGRAGWAELLSRLVVDGDGDGLATGQPLLDRVASLAHEISGSAALADALACIASLGSASLGDLEVLADITGVPYGDLVVWLEATAQGGLVERTGERWTVLSPLQTLLVASTFFGERKRRQWATFSAKFPQDHRLERTVLKVASITPNPELAGLAEAWFTRKRTDPLNTETLELMRLYARIGEQEANRAAALARKVLEEPRQVEMLYRGITYDPMGEAAEAVLRTALRRACSQEAVEGLLDLAMTDHRPRHQHPNHPMRAIQELAQLLDPDAGPVDSLRGRILTHALNWFDRSPSGERWSVLAELSRYVFDPTVEGSWTDPGSHRTFTMARALMAASAMGPLLDLWDQIDTRVRSRAGLLITHSTVAELCRIFNRWTSLTVGEADAGEKLTAAHTSAAARGAKLVYATLASLSERFPAVPIAVNRQLGLVEMWNGGKSDLAEIPVADDRLARFVWVREPDDDIDSWMAEQRANRTSLASEIVALGAAQGIVEYQRLLKEAEVLEGNHEGELLAHDLAAQAVDADVWLGIAVKERIHSLISPMLAKARSRGQNVQDEVLAALDVAALRASVLRTILQEEGELDLLAHSVIDALDEGDAAQIGRFWVLDSVTPILRALLRHPLREVRTLAALSFSEGLNHGPDLPEDLRPAWRAALIEADPDEVPQHAKGRLLKVMGNTVKTDPGLCAEWFIAEASALAGSRPVSQHWMVSFSKILRTLPREQKRRVCTALSNDSLLASGFAGDFLASDEILTEELLKDGTVDAETVLSAMSGFRDNTLEVAAPPLVRAGVSPKLIAASALGSRHWSGSEAASIREDLQFFAELGERRPDLLEVCAAAANQLKEELEDATIREERERILGW